VTVPRAHGLQTVPDGVNENLPTSQRTQEVWPVCGCTVPLPEFGGLAGTPVSTPHGRQLMLPLTAEYRPSLQLGHASTPVEIEFAVPAGHGVHEDAPGMGLKEPIGHGLQTTRPVVFA
jgi:hypothetical protein